MRYGVFPAISENKDVAVTGDSSPPVWDGEPQEHSGRRRILVIWQPSDCSYSLWWATGSSGCEKHRILASHSWDAYESNGFSNEPRLLNLPIHRKALNSLTLDIWFPLIHKNIFNIQTICVSIEKLLYNPAPPSASSNHFFQAYLRMLSPCLSPKSSCWIKHNSQLLGYEYIFKI